MGATSEMFIQMQEEFMNTCENVDNGEISVLDAVIEMRNQRAMHEQMLKNFKNFEKEKADEIETEADAYGNKYKGATFEFRSGGKSFDYKGISEIDELENQLKEKKSLYKTAWENKQKGLLNVTEDGEELQLPKVKYRASSMIVKLPKGLG